MVLIAGLDEESGIPKRTFLPSCSLNNIMWPSQKAARQSVVDG